MIVITEFNKWYRELEFVYKEVQVNEKTLQFLVTSGPTYEVCLDGKVIYSSKSLRLAVEAYNKAEEPNED